MCKKIIIFSFIILLLFNNCKETKSEQNVEINKNIKKTSLILPTKNELGKSIISTMVADIITHYPNQK